VSKVVSKFSHRRRVDGRRSAHRARGLIIRTGSALNRVLKRSQWCSRDHTVQCGEWGCVRPSTLFHNDALLRVDKDVIAMPVFAQHLVIAVRIALGTDDGIARLTLQGNGRLEILDQRCVPGVEYVGSAKSGGG
jgi:hypothetical protein